MSTPTTTQSPGSARQRLLDAADELFYGQGINATGVDAIVERAEVAIATLYNQFGGKDRLVAAYLDERHRRWCRDWEAAIAAADDPIERVLAIFDALRGWWEAGALQRGCAHVDAVAEIADAHHPAALAAARHKAELRHRLTELVAATEVADPTGTAADLVILYEGALSALLLDLVPDPCARARRLGAALLAPPQRANSP